MLKKELTKKSLDELAQVMPVLSEKEQSEMVGGDHFYVKTQNGEYKYLGESGTGNGLNVVNPSIYNQYVEGNATWSDMTQSNRTRTASQELSGGNLTVSGLQVIFNEMAQQRFGSGAALHVVSPTDMPNMSNLNGGTQQGQMYINQNFVTSCIKNNNMQDFMATVSHEMGHVQYSYALDNYCDQHFPNMPISDKLIISEYLAYRQEGNNLSGTTSDYRNTFYQLKQQNEAELQNLKRKYGEGAINDLIYQISH